MTMDRIESLPFRVKAGQKAYYESARKKEEERIMAERKDREKRLMTSGVVPPELRGILK